MAKRDRRVVAVWLFVDAGSSDVSGDEADEWNAEHPGETPKTGQDAVSGDKTSPVCRHRRSSSV